MKGILLSYEAEEFIKREMEQHLRLVNEVINNVEFFGENEKLKAEKDLDIMNDLTKQLEGEAVL